MTAWKWRVMRVAGSPAAPYVGAVGVRTAARAVWGLALPAAFTVAAYGRYQLLATIAAMAAQLAVLGAPQTIVRHTGSRLPMGALLANAGVLAAAAIVVAAALVPAVRSQATILALAVAVLATIAATLAGARAKARFAFTSSFRAEGLGAAVLVGAAVLAAGVPGGVRLSSAGALLVESLALAVTAGVLLGVGARERARVETHGSSGEGAAPDSAPSTRAVFGNVYSVGALVLIDVVLFRRLEVYFLERSPDGIAGVAVLGLSLQIAAVALLVPTALLEAWQPKLALVRRDGGDAAFEREVRRRGRQFAPLMVALALLGTAVPLVAVPIAFPQYRPWLWYIVAFVATRLACAGAGFYSAALYAVGRQRALYVPAGVSGLVALLVNGTFTVRLGLRGALIAYAVTQVVVAALTVIAYYRDVGSRAGLPVRAALAGD